MALESNIFDEFYEHLRSYMPSQLDYIRSWFKADVTGIEAAGLPALCVYVTNIRPDTQTTQGVLNRMELMVKGMVQHFNPNGIITGEKGHKGVLDVYSDIDRIIFSMQNWDEITTDGVTTKTRQGPIFPDYPQVRNITIGDAEFGVEQYENSYPNIVARIPVTLTYAYSDEARML